MEGYSGQQPGYQPQPQAPAPHPGYEVEKEGMKVYSQLQFGLIALFVGIILKAAGYMALTADPPEYDIALSLWAIGHIVIGIGVLLITLALFYGAIRAKHNHYITRVAMIVSAAIIIAVTIMSDVVPSLSNLF